MRTFMSYFSTFPNCLTVIINAKYPRQRHGTVCVAQVILLTPTQNLTFLPHDATYNAVGYMLWGD